MSFSGVYTAIVTPFKNNEVDYSALEQLIEMQVRGGVDGIVAVGTTGESPTLNMKEHVEVIRFIINQCKGKCKVIAGTGGNSTEEAIELTLHAFKDGADGSLQVAPYYNKPSQEGLFRHFTTISNAAPELPMILYNVPGRSAVEIAVETVARLSENPSIPAIKEAGGSVDRVSRIKDACDITVLSGDDSLTLPMMSVGGEGVISVLSNIMPAEMVQLVSLANAMKYKEAAELHKKLYPLMRDLFIDSNPVPAKALLAKMGIISEEVRLPLVEMSAANLKTLFQSAQKAGLQL
jgi:4-hydroxy-tetrahydrodipicolinate synthase